MKKEKTVKTYQRRTKSGKIVTVKQHTAKYDAADKAKELAKKKGAGGELEEKLSKKKETPKVEPPVEDDLGFTKDEFKEWYNGTGSDADKKVTKILKSKFGRTGYRKLEDEAIDNYTARGYGKLMKKLGGDEHPFKAVKAAKKESSTKKTSPETNNEKNLTSVNQLKEGSVIKFSEGGSKITISKIHPSGRVTIVDDSGSKHVFGSLKQAFNNWKDVGKLVNSEVEKPKKNDSLNEIGKKKSSSKEKPQNLKTQMSHLIEGLHNSHHFSKPAKFIQRKDGSIEAHVGDFEISSKLHNDGWKNVDKVAVIGGSSHYVSKDGKHFATVYPNVTSIRKVKEGEKVSGHSWDSIFDRGSDASRYD